MSRSAPALILTLFLAIVAGAESPDRERIIDMFASDAIERIDFTATSFDEALGRIELVTDRILDQTAPLGLAPGDQVTLCAAVIEALDDFRPRVDGYTFGELTLVILNDGDAEVLADLVAATATVIHEGGRIATAQSAAESLYRGIVIDTEEGIPPLEQLLEHVRAVNGMPLDERERFLP
jgi:hypothetical protein